MTYPIDPKHDPLRRSLPVEEWPEQDRAAWLAARAPGDPLEPAGDGRGARWRPSSVKAFAKGYGRYLAFLSRKGLFDPDVPARTRITREIVGAYVTELETLNASQTVVSVVRSLNCAVRAMWPNQDWDWFKPIIRNLARKVVPARDKRSRIVPVQDLLELGRELMAKAEAGNGTPLKRALLYRDGLMIALLAARPFREGNFASIKIGHHLTKQGETYWLCFDGSETKTHRAIELPLPVEFNPYIERYCAFYRPLLFPRNRGSKLGTDETGENCNALWLSLRGRPMPPNTVYERITTRTRVKFGHAVYPHLIRDCAATSIANDDPAHVRIAPSVLTHNTFTTTEKYYIHAQMVEAVRLHQREIDLLRGSEP